MAAGGRRPTLDVANGSSAEGGGGIPSLLDSARSSVRAGAWLTDRWILSPRVRLEPGLRLDWSGVSGETIGSPRLAALFDLTERTRVRVAGGLFTQSPGYEKLLQSDYFVDLTDSGDLSVRSERAWQALAAVERRLDPGVTLRVEGYYKDFDRLVLGRLETPEEVAARVATYDFPDELAFGIPRAPQVTTIPENIGTGRAYGVEFYAEKRATSAGTRLSGWASYTLGRAETTAYGRTFAADYDRRHALSVVSSFRVSRLVELATTFRAQSGFPYTPPLGVVPASVEDPVAAAEGVTRRVPLYDNLGLLVWSADYGDTSNFNTARLPIFARVDAARDLPAALGEQPLAVLLRGHQPAQPGQRERAGGGARSTIRSPTGRSSPKCAANGCRCSRASGCGIGFRPRRSQGHEDTKTRRRPVLLADPQVMLTARRERATRI